MLHVPVTSSAPFLEPAPERCNQGVIYDENTYDIIGVLCPYEAALYATCTKLLTKIGLLTIKQKTKKDCEPSIQTDIDELTEKQKFAESALKARLTRNYGESITKRTILVSEDWQLCELAAFDHTCVEHSCQTGTIGDTVYEIPLDDE